LKADLKVKTNHLSGSIGDMWNYHIKSSRVTGSITDGGPTRIVSRNYQPPTGTLDTYVVVDNRFGCSKSGWKSSSGLIDEGTDALLKNRKFKAYWNGDFDITTQTRTTDYFDVYMPDFDSANVNYLSKDYSKYETTVKWEHLRYKHGRFDYSTMKKAVKIGDYAGTGAEILGGVSTANEAIVHFLDRDENNLWYVDTIYYSGETALSCTKTGLDIAKFRKLINPEDIKIKAVAIAKDAIDVAYYIAKAYLSNNLLDFQIAIEQMVTAAIQLACTICMYVIPVVGWILAAIDGIIMLVSTIATLFGANCGTLSLGKLIVEGFLWILGLTPGEDKLAALSGANDELSLEYNRRIEANEDPHEHWFMIPAEPPPR
jgi:hypothetical protein